MSPPTPEAEAPSTRRFTQTKAPLWIGLAGYQAAWFACILAAAAGRPGLAVAAVAASTAWLLAFSDDRRADLLLIVAAVLVGTAWDTMLLRSGLVAYASPGPVDGLAPAWIVALWAQFAALLRDPLRWLHHRLPWAALLGGVGGALSYAGAARLGACRFDEPTLALAVIGAGWAVLAPGLLVLAKRLDRAKAETVQLR